MVFTKPFTADQRRRAAAIYRSYRANLQEIRHRFRPRNIEQRRMIRDYRQVLHDFPDALKAEDAKVNVARLNALMDRADTLALAYAMARNAWRG